MKSTDWRHLNFKLKYAVRIWSSDPYTKSSNFFLISFENVLDIFTGSGQITLNDNFYELFLKYYFRWLIKWILDNLK